MTEHIKEGQIIIFEGPQRSGKTLAMSIFAKEDNRVGKREIFSNITYTFPFTPLNFKSLTLKQENKTLKHGSITIDELNFFLDNRGSMTKLNREFLQFLLQVKKQGINLYGTTHNLGYMDLRFRQNYDYLIRTSVFPEQKIRGDNPPELLRLEIFNGPHQKPLHKIRKIPLKGLLGMYDTHHVFNPFEELASDADKERPKQKPIIEPRPKFQGI